MNFLCSNVTLVSQCECAEEYTPEVKELFAVMDIDDRLLYYVDENGNKYYVDVAENAAEAVCKALGYPSQLLTGNTIDLNSESMLKARKTFLERFFKYSKK